MTTPLQIPHRAALTVVAFALTLAFTAQAAAHNQDGDNDTKVGVERRLEQMKKRLALTDEQVEKLKPILEQNRKEGEALREKHKGNKKALFEAAKARSEAFEKEVAAVLTPEQNTKFLEARATMKGKVKERMSKRKSDDAK